MTVVKGVGNEVEEKEGIDKGNKNMEMEEK